MDQDILEYLGQNGVIIDKENRTVEIDIGGKTKLYTLRGIK